MATQKQIETMTTINEKRPGRKRGLGRRKEGRSLSPRPSSRSISPRPGAVRSNSAKNLGEKKAERQARSNRSVKNNEANNQSNGSLNSMHTLRGLANRSVKTNEDNNQSNGSLNGRPTMRGLAKNGRTYSPNRGGMPGVTCELNHAPMNYENGNGDHPALAVAAEAATTPGATHSNTRRMLGERKANREARLREKQSAGDSQARNIDSQRSMLSVQEAGVNQPDEHQPSRNYSTTTIEDQPPSTLEEHPPAPLEDLEDPPSAEMDNSSQRPGVRWESNPQPSEEAPEMAHPATVTRISKIEAESILQKYKYVIGVVVLLVLAVAIVIPLALLDGKHGRGDESVALVDPAPSMTFPPHMDIDPSLLPGLPDSTWQAMLDDQSPQYQAYSWITKDPQLQQYDDWQLRQRFALATFYYAMGGLRWGMPNWLDYDVNECAWLTDPNTCHEDGNFKFINITKQRGFKGSLPPELSLLTHLEGMDFSNNVLGGNLTDLFGNEFSHPSLQVFWCSKCRMSGSFPSELVQLPHLTGIILTGNDITGELPSEIGQMPLLTHLKLEDNQISGAIPTTIGNMESLKIFQLRNNKLNAIPSEVGRLASLSYLDLGSNAFAQAIPSELGELNQLLYLGLDDNGFKTTIPSQVGLLTNLVELVLNKNDMSGSIPEELTFLPNLEVMFLHENQLTGTVTSSIGTMSNLRQIDLNSNMLTATIPSELGLLNQLQTLYLYNNELLGSIPKELAGIPGLGFLDVRSNSGIVEHYPEEFCARPRLQVKTDWCGEGGAMPCCT